MKKGFNNNIQFLRRDTNNCHPELVSGSENRFRNEFGMTKNNRKELIYLITYLPIHFKKAAFTLAEVLITLGIIGVVAALTIPTLIANTNGQKFRSQFKKTISTLNQAVRLNKANYDFDFSDAESCDGPWNGNPYTEKSETPDKDMTFCAIFNGSLKGFSIDAYYTNFYIDPNDKVLDNTNIYNILAASEEMLAITMYWGERGSAYVLSDGSLFAFQVFAQKGDCDIPVGTSLNSKLSNITVDSPFRYCLAFIDVNGPTPPNKEVKCKTGTTSFDLDEPCIVDSKTIGDVFPVVFYNSTVAPATNAAKYVLNTAK
ncbi:type II secretion system protein [bacterium]|nr:type II secretion system protein [bacterium]